MNALTILEIVKKIVGGIFPAGETNHDRKSHRNLEEMCILTDHLISEIREVAELNENRYEGSRAKSGKYARNFLNILLEDSFDENNIS